MLANGQEEEEAIWEVLKSPEYLAATMDEILILDVVISFLDSESDCQLWSADSVNCLKKQHSIAQIARLNATSTNVSE